MGGGQRWVAGRLRGWSPGSLQAGGLQMGIGGLQGPFSQLDADFGREQSSTSLEAL